MEAVTAAIAKQQTGTPPRRRASTRRQTLPAGGRCPLPTPGTAYIPAQPLGAECRGGVWALDFEKEEKYGADSLFSHKN